MFLNSIESYVISICYYGVYVKIENQIKYQKDDTIQTITGLNSTRDPPILPSINTSFQTHLQNGHFSKRNKLVTKRKELKNLIFKHKVNRIQKTFIKKMRLNSVFRDPC